MRRADLFGRRVVDEAQAQDAVVVRVDAEVFDEAVGIERATGGHDAVAGEAVGDDGAGFAQVERDGGGADRGIGGADDADVVAAAEVVDQRGEERLLLRAHRGVGAAVGIAGAAGDFGDGLEVVDDAGAGGDLGVVGTGGGQDFARGCRR